MCIIAEAWLIKQVTIRQQIMHACKPLPVFAFAIWLVAHVRVHNFSCVAVQKINALVTTGKKAEEQT